MNPYESPTLPLAIAPLPSSSPFSSQNVNLRKVELLSSSEWIQQLNEMIRNLDIVSRGVRNANNNEIHVTEDEVAEEDVEGVYENNDSIRILNLHLPNNKMAPIYSKLQKHLSKAVFECLLRHSNEALVHIRRHSLRKRPSNPKDPFAPIVNEKEDIFHQLEKNCKIRTNLMQWIGSRHQEIQDLQIANEKYDEELYRTAERNGYIAVSTELRRFQPASCIKDKQRVNLQLRVDEEILSLRLQYKELKSKRKTVKEELKKCNEEIALHTQGEFTELSESNFEKLRNTCKTNEEAAEKQLKEVHALQRELLEIRQKRDEARAKHETKVDKLKEKIKFAEQEHISSKLWLGRKMKEQEYVSSKVNRYKSKAKVLQQFINNT